MADMTGKINIVAEMQDMASAKVRQMTDELERASQQSTTTAQSMATLGNGAVIAGAGMTQLGRATANVKPYAVDPLINANAALATSTASAAASTGLLSRAFSSVGTSLIATTTAYLGAGAAISATSKLIGDSIRDFREAEVAAVRLSFALKQSSLTQGVGASSLTPWIEGLSRMTAVDDEAIAGLTAMAITMGRTAEEAQRVVEVALDMEAALGIDARSGVFALTKAYEGNDTQLRRLIPTLGQYTDQQLRAGDALVAVANQVGPAAEAMGNTTDAAFRRISIWAENARESIGNVLVGVVALQGGLNGLRAPEMRKTDVIGGPVSELGGNFEPLEVVSDSISEIDEKFKRVVSTTQLEIETRAVLIEQMTREGVAIGEAIIAMERVADVDPRADMATVLPAPDWMNTLPDWWTGPILQEPVWFSGLPDWWTGPMDPKAGFRPVADRLPSRLGPDVVQGPFSRIDSDTWSPSDTEQQGSLINELSVSFFDNVVDGFGRSESAADSFFEKIADSFRRIAEQAAGQIISNAIRNAIPGGGLLPSDARADVRTLVRTDIRREMQLASARGRF